jgi:hypothetical protein
MKNLKFALLWCGLAKASETLSLTLGHLWQGFLFIPKNSDVMESKINLVPLAEMLSLEGFSASEMSEFFDELAYDYAKTIIELQMADLSPRIILHEKTDQFLYLMRELRDVFRQCNY